MCRHGETGQLVIASRVRDIDACLMPLVTALNQAGLTTIASCCGHGHRPGRVDLADGRTLVLARSHDEADLIDQLFPLDIHGSTSGANDLERAEREGSEASTREIKPRA